MLKVQEYLRSGKSLDDLKAKYGIKSSIKNGKVALNYDQINSPMGKRICQECRGLILEIDSWNVICAPFWKFFNYEEGHAAKIDWESARIFNKIDGSLISAYFHNDQWHFSTRSVPEADIPNQNGFTFFQLVQKALENMKIDYPLFINGLNKSYTYMFELVAPESQVYIQYPEAKLYLIGVRDNISLEEKDILEISKEIGIPCPEMYKLNSLDDMVAFVNSRKGFEHEGIVVCDRFYNRVKIKSDSYKDGQAMVFSMSASDRNIMRIIMAGEDDDLYSKCPKFVQEKITIFKHELKKLIKQTENDYLAVKNIDNMKVAAKIILAKKWSGALFALKRNKVSSVAEYVKQTDVDTILELCGIKKEHK